MSISSIMHDAKCRLPFIFASALALDFIPHPTRLWPSIAPKHHESEDTILKAWMWIARPTDILLCVIFIYVLYFFSFQYGASSFLAMNMLWHWGKQSALRWSRECDGTKALGNWGVIHMLKEWAMATCIPTFSRGRKYAFGENCEQDGKYGGWNFYFPAACT